MNAQAHELIQQQRTLMNEAYEQSREKALQLAEAIWQEFLPQAEERIGNEFMFETKDWSRDGLAELFVIICEDHIYKVIQKRMISNNIKALREVLPEARSGFQDGIEAYIEEELQLIREWFTSKLERTMNEALPSFSDLIETTFIHLFKSEEDKFERMEVDIKNNARRIKQGFRDIHNTVIRCVGSNHIDPIIERAAKSYLQWLDSVEAIHQ